MSHFLPRNTKPKPREAATRILWLFLYARAHRVLCYGDVAANTGMSRRTYFRYVKILRNAGVMLELERENGWLRYLGFDVARAPIVGAMRNASREAVS